VGDASNEDGTASVKSIDVTTSDDGVPIYFALDRQIWLVGPQPVRWFERVSWSLRLR
jgi:hypothetical protein